MDIFGVGVLELVFILIIAMIVIGPRDLGKAGRQVGRFLNRVYKSESWRMLNEASRTLRNLPNRLAREAQLEELDSIRDSLKDTGRMIQAEAKELDSSLEAWTPKPSVSTRASSQEATDQAQQTPEQPEGGEG